MKNVLSAMVVAVGIGLLLPQEAPAGGPVQEKTVDTASGTCQYYDPPGPEVSCTQVDQYCASQFLYNTCCTDTCGGAACAIQNQQNYQDCLYIRQCAEEPALPEELPC